MRRERSERVGRSSGAVWDFRSFMEWPVETFVLACWVAPESAMVARLLADSGNFERFEKRHKMHRQNRLVLASLPCTPRWPTHELANSGHSDDIRQASRGATGEHRRAACERIAPIEPSRSRGQLLQLLFGHLLQLINACKIEPEHLARRSLQLHLGVILSACFRSSSVGSIRSVSMGEASTRLWPCLG